MKYTKFQQEYLDSVNGEVSDSAVGIIGLLEKTIMAQSKLLVCYRIGKPPPEWVLDAIKKAKSQGVDI